MPPRFAYWTVLIDNGPTAFRARTRDELLPTLKQLQSRNPSAVLKWFARGRLWESPEEAMRVQEERRRTTRSVEKRAGGWRPGGQHRDPRARFGAKRPGRTRAPKEPRRKR